ncbi:WW domain-binding protein 4-like isoform X2 [Artemia franciscana]|uniref:WW domain-binding protein 4 n=2 Tax=Artemia franciscana TaxID=6661 RepID=A0AA88HVE6_ARTSF|nr:hypothetical protein QYM36_010431 [Artemia franciscana]KAK2715863.1 hypothetical protein QYM36_010431 [Artemia franciscana]
MSEYWKSTPKKFCDFCKCWIADNKASVQFHESGKNHKENVTKKITDLRKKGIKEKQEKDEFDEEMRRIEEAALEAYQSDVYKNPDMTGFEVQQKVEEVTGEKIEKECDWYEAKSDEGHIYYWNIKTQATQWEKPAYGYFTLEEQQKRDEKPLEDVKKNLVSEEEKNDKPKGIKLSKPTLIFKKKVSKEEKKVVSKEEVSTPIAYGPVPAGDPYGGWETRVKPMTDQAGPVDLQLPQTDLEEIPVPQLHPEKRFSFQTKVVNSLGGTAEFKKRRINEETKRNVRTRGED